MNHPLDRFTPAIEYVFRVLLTDCGDFEQLRRHLTYGDQPPAGASHPHLCIRPSDFFSRYGERCSLPNASLAQVGDVPLIYGSPEIERRQTDAGDLLLVDADLIASSFFMLARYEEWVRGGTSEPPVDADGFDRYGRFRGTESLASRAGFIDRPIVDEYGQLLRAWMREVGIDVAEPAREFSVLMSHDVDHPLRYSNGRGIRSIAGDVVNRRRSMGRNLLNAASLLGLARDPYDTFDALFSSAGVLRDAYGEHRFRQIFFMVAGGSEEADCAYDLTSPPIQKICTRIGDAGGEFGLHSSFSASLAPELIKAEKETLETALKREVTFNRHHYLAWRNVRDAGALMDAGLNDDSTLGYPDLAGFRLGVCRSVPLFDPAGLRELETIEHPLLLMDRTVASAAYMNLPLEQARNYSRNMIDQTKRHRGEFVFLWHNSLFYDDATGYQQSLFDDVIKMLAERA